MAFWFRTKCYIKLFYLHRYYQIPVLLLLTPASQDALLLVSGKVYSSPSVLPNTCAVASDTSFKRRSTAYEWQGIFVKHVASKITEVSFGRSPSPV